MDISINGLNKGFHTAGSRKKVLTDLHLELKNPCIFALMGPNGSGKTTLLKILATLILPDSGEVRFNGKDLVKDGAFIRKIAGFVMDAEHSFYQMLTLEENLKFFGGLRGVSGSDCERRTRELADDFGIGGFLGEKAAHCSSGTMQKAAFVRALLHEPSVLLVDEFEKSLDEDSQSRITRRLKNLKETKGTTALCVTHDRRWAKDHADAAGTIAGGRIEK
ncbi:MAG: ABC transporter ATP-binding protein [Endomicrobiales bacterium]|nr:ABC transporter ATP-binding protein [Endomicrobiales bacterium]